MRKETMNPSEKKKSEMENEGDIREERDPKPIPASQDVEEGEETEYKEWNLPPAMPQGPELCDNVRNFKVAVRSQVGALAFCVL
jgi:hypothetical protein